jgi:hypothetical protein
MNFQEMHTEKKDFFCEFQIWFYFIICGQLQKKLWFLPRQQKFEKALLVATKVRFQQSIFDVSFNFSQKNGSFSMD